MTYKIPGRADTPEKKRAIIERLYSAWLASPHQRLGQLMLNSALSEAFLYNLEDEILIVDIENLCYGKPRR